jgi:hypothetical protein
MNRTPDVERQSESVVDDFITMVDMFRVQRRCSMVQGDLDRARMVRSAYVRQKLGSYAPSGPTSAKSALSNSRGDQSLASQSPISGPQIVFIDPIGTVKDIISDLHERYDVAVRDALDICRKQDDVQRKASELLPDAEHLLSQIGDRVRKVSRAVVNSSYEVTCLTFTLRICSSVRFEKASTPWTLSSLAIVRPITA